MPILAPIFCQMAAQDMDRCILPAAADATAICIACRYRVDYAPAFQSHIALGSDGRLIGYDFWDDDEWPDDSDPRRNIFFPLHHGSTVFSVLSRESGDSTISIYRFPAEQMCRFSALLTHIANTPVRVVNLSMGSDDHEDWRCFETAARNLPGLLFVVSAGNNDRDIDVDPVYPASHALQNMIVVSSADASGWDRGQIMVRRMSISWSRRGNRGD